MYSIDPTRSKTKNKNTRVRSNADVPWVFTTNYFINADDASRSHSFSITLHTQNPNAPKWKFPKCLAWKWIKRFLNFDTQEVTKYRHHPPPSPPCRPLTKHTTELKIASGKRSRKKRIIIWIKYAHAQTIRIMRNFAFYLDIEIVYAWEIYCIHFRCFITFTFWLFIFIFQVSVFGFKIHAHILAHANQIFLENTMLSRHKLIFFSESSVPFEYMECKNGSQLKRYISLSKQNSKRKSRFRAKKKRTHTHRENLEVVEGDHSRLPFGATQFVTRTIIIMKIMVRLDYLSFGKIFVEYPLRCCVFIFMCVCVCCSFSGAFVN